MADQTGGIVSKRASRAWYLAPVVLGVIGGFAGFFANKDDDRRFAKRLMAVGLIQTVLVFLIPVGLGAWQAYKYRKQIRAVTDVFGGVTGGVVPSGLGGEQDIGALAKIFGALGSLAPPVFLRDGEVKDFTSPVGIEGAYCGKGTLDTFFFNTSDATVPVEALSQIEVTVNKRRVDCQWQEPLAPRGKTTCVTSMPARVGEFLEIKARLGVFETGLSGECRG